MQVDNAGDLDARVNRLCELNAIEQAVHVCKSTVVQDAWARGQPLAVHASSTRLTMAGCATLDSA